MKLIEDSDEIVREDTGACLVGTTDGIVTLLGHNGKKSGNGRIAIHCTKCELDEELFGAGLFWTSRNNGKELKGCGCCGKLPADKKLIKIKRILESEGYEYRGLIQEDSNTVRTGDKLKLTCPKGHNYETTSITKFLDCGRRCPHCANNVPKSVECFAWEGTKKHKGSYEYPMVRKKIENKNKFAVRCPLHGIWWTDFNHHINRGQGCPHPECCWKKISEVKSYTQEDFLEKARKVHGDKYDYSNTSYGRSFTKIEIFCKECVENFTQTAGCHLSGNGCPTCSGRTQKQVYIFGVMDQGNIIALKSGIANDYKTRLNRQNNQSVFDVKLLKLFEFEETSDCRVAEKVCKASLNNHYLNRKEYPDGFMETYPVSDFQKIIDIIKNNNGAECKL